MFGTHFGPVYRKRGCPYEKQVNLYKRDNFVLIFTPSSSSPTATTTTTSSKKRLLEREICNVIKMSIRHDAIKLLTQ